MYNPYSLEGKKILITGASSGIGRTSAVECSKMGATLVITGRNEGRLLQTLNSLEGKGHQAIAVDLTNDEGIAKLVAETPALDGVFLCAGITDTTPVKFITTEKMARVMDLNLVSPTVTLKSLLTKKKINKGASLVFMSSMGAYQLAPGLGIYAASKRGLNAIMRAFAQELSVRKIRANSIMPSMVRTELLGTLSFSEEELAEDEKRYPFGYGKPQDVAYAAIYLLSDASGWMTGSEIRMDGGSTL